MFGYVRAHKAQLRVCEYEAYKGVYCSLCRTQGRLYGPLTRFMLSYDIAFLAMLHLSVQGGCGGFADKHCVFNPLKKCKYCKGGSQALEYAASVAMLLSYYKLRDSIDDSRGLKRAVFKLLHPYYNRKRKKAAGLYPKAAEIALEYYEGQRQTEQTPDAGLDAAAEPTAKALQSYFALCAGGGESRPLARMGYCIGKWVYLLDAGADLEKDIKSGAFNPLKAGLQGQDIQGYLQKVLVPNLNVCITECAAAFELADCHDFRPILENVIYLGLKQTQNTVLNKENKQ